MFPPFVDEVLLPAAVVVVAGGCDDDDVVVVAAASVVVVDDDDNDNDDDDDVVDDVDEVDDVADDVVVVVVAVVIVVVDDNDDDDDVGGGVRTVDSSSTGRNKRLLHITCAKSCSCTRFCCTNCPRLAHASVASSWRGSKAAAASTPDCLTAKRACLRCPFTFNRRPIATGRRSEAVSK